MFLWALSHHSLQQAPCSPLLLLSLCWDLPQPRVWHLKCLVLGLPPSTLSRGFPSRRQCPGKQASSPGPPPELSGGWGIPSWLNCNCAQTGTLLWRSLCQLVGAGSGRPGHFPRLASTVVGEVPRPVAVLTNQGATCTGKMVAGRSAAGDTSEASVGLRTATHISPALHQSYGLGPGHTGGPPDSKQRAGRQHQCLQDTGGTPISQK